MDIAVLNNSGGAILIGQVVYQTGFVQPQQVPSIALASAATISTAKALGIAITNISDNSIGQVRISGDYSPIDTSSFLLNAPVYLSDTFGEISNIPGTIEVIIGQVSVVSTDGCISIVCRIPSGCTPSGGATGIQGETGLMGVTGVQGETGIQGVTGLGTGTITYLEMSGTQSVPSGGIRFLRIGQTFTSAAGYQTLEDVTLTGISIKVNTSDATRDFDLEILSPSSTIPTVIATLALPLGSSSASTTAISVAISAGSEVGAQLTRTSGSGASDFTSYVVLLKLEA